MPEVVDALLARRAHALKNERLIDSGYGLNYFEQLKTEWSLLPGSVPRMSKGAWERLQAILSKKAEELTWDDLYAVERMLTRAVPPERLIRLAIAIRKEYKEAVGPESYKEYEAGNPPPADGSDEQALRADTEQLQSELQWLYVIQPVEELSRNQLTKWLLGMILVLGAGVFGWVWWLGARFQPISFVIFAGALGAVFSAQRRIQTVSDRRTSLVHIMRSGSYRLGVQIAPVIGAFSAVALAFLFASGLMQGGLFPEVAVTAHGEGLPLCAGFVLGQHDVTADFAKLLVWSFIAGFAERLVPDALDRLANRNNRQNPPATSS